jgi:protein-disulfide isomerase
VSDRGGQVIGAAIGGGIIGAALTAALLFFAAPQWLGPRLVRQALTSQPEILIEGSDALRDKQFAKTIAPIRTALEVPFYSAWKGASRPDVTITYFFDYACGFCRKSNPDLDRLLKEDKGLRVVYREFPILGPDSLAAARASLAAAKAGRFARFHDTLFQAGRPAPDTITFAGRAAAIDLNKTMDDPAIEAELGKNMQLGGQLGATGTPLFVVGDRVINAAVGYEELKKAVADARAKG